MTRPPCTCAARACRPCFLIARRDDYARLWGVADDDRAAVRERVDRLGGWVVPPVPATAKPAERYLAPPCAHRGEPTGETAQCQTCGGKRQLPLLACAVHGRCHTTSYVTDGATRCMGCRDRSVTPPRRPPSTAPARPR